jgi:hypothetical protein
LKKIRLILIIPLLYLIALSNHRAYSSSYVLKKLVYSKYGPASYKEQIKKDQYAFVAAKKSRKAKGIKVHVPQIGNYYNAISFLFSAYLFPAHVVSFTPSYLCDNSGRGPPTA